MSGLDVDSKSVRVYNFQKKTVEAACDILGAIGLKSADELERHHVLRRVNAKEVATLAEIYPTIDVNSLMKGTAPPQYMKMWVDGLKLNDKSKMVKQATGKIPDQRRMENDLPGYQQLN